MVDKEDRPFLEYINGQLKTKFDDHRDAIVNSNVAHEPKLIDTCKMWLESQSTIKAAMK